MSPGVEKVELMRTCCWFVMSRRPGHPTGTLTWGCPASPCRSGTTLAASASETSGSGSSCVSCTCATKKRIRSGSEILRLEMLTGLADLI